MKNDADLQELRARLERTHADIAEALYRLEDYINERRKAVRVLSPANIIGQQKGENADDR